MLETALAVPLWFELLATVVYAISGSMSAVRARYDIFGTVTLAVTVGLLGGIIRDILLQDFGIYAFQNPTLILACALTGVVVFFFGKITKYFNWLFDFIDALGMALWTIISVSKGLSAGLEIIPAVIMGTITAIGGGIARGVHEPAGRGLPFGHALRVCCAHRRDRLRAHAAKPRAGKLGGRLLRGHRADRALRFRRT